MGALLVNNLLLGAKVWCVSRLAGVSIALGANGGRLAGVFRELIFDRCMIVVDEVGMVDVSVGDGG